MSLTNGEKRLDEDILQSKADILRARNLIPPLGKPPVAKLQESAPIKSEPDVPQRTIQEQPDKTPQPQPFHAVTAPLETNEEPFESNDDIELLAQQMADADIDAEIEEESRSGISEPLMAENPPQVSAPADIKAQKTEHEEEEPSIPSFNLAEQIMAEQRKVSANRRKGPGLKIPIVEIRPDPKPAAIEKPQVPVIEKPAPIARPTIAAKPFIDEPSTPEQKLIAKIVARDIQRLRRSVAML
jgi:hypothetical protein